MSKKNSYSGRNLDREMADVLIAISVVSRRLAGKMERAMKKGEKYHEKKRIFADCR